MDFRILLLSALLAVVYAQDSNIRIEIQPEIAQLGDNVAIRCYVVGLKPGDLVVWYKKQGDEPVDVIAYNENIVNPTYQERFEALGAEITGDELLFILNIKESAYEDSGFYGCKPNSQEEYAYAEFAVAMEIGSIQMFGWRTNETEETAHELENKAKLEVNEGDEYFLKCVAKGGNPAPSMSMTINGETSIDEHFERSESRYTEDTIISPFSHKFLQWEVALTSKDVIKITPEMNHERIVCTAQVAELEAHTFSVTPILKSMPRIDCEDSQPTVDGIQVGVGLYQKDAEIACTVMSDPEPEMVEWHLPTQGGNITLETGGHFAGINAEKFVDEETGVVTYKLIFDRIMKSHLRIFKIKVNNGIGTSQEKITLVDIGTGGSISGSVSLHDSMATTLLITAAAFIKSLVL